MTFRCLIACECSGRVRDEFAVRGWEAWSADLLPSEIPAYITVFDQDNAITDASGASHGNHYQGDCRDLFSDTHPVNARRLGEWLVTPGMRGLWDLVIAHPPCTDLSLAGANRWAQKQADGRQQAAEEFFWELYNAPAPFVAVENPRGWIGAPSNPNCVKPTQTVQPWMFGDPYEKATCLWLRGLPELYADKPVAPVGRITTGGGSWRTDKAAQKTAMNLLEDSEGRKNRAKVRSRTMPGFARAMAAQWAPFVEEYFVELHD